MVQNDEMNEQEIIFAMSQIRHVLARSPCRADTTAGIHAYWILWNEPRPLPPTTEEALQRLKLLGEVSHAQLEDGTWVWSKHSTVTAKATK